MAAFHVAPMDWAARGDVTDIYFKRTVDVLRAAGLDGVRVRAEFHVSSLPHGYRWAVFTGLKEALALLEGRPVTVYAMREGTVFYPNEPLMVVEGRYVDFAVLETPLLGILRHYTSISTKAARVKRAMGDRACLFFGARALHPAIQPMADRAAYIGGCDGVANTLGAAMMGLRPTGTMPHALMILFRAVTGDHTEAWTWFDRAMPEEVPRIVLVDTFLDEREEAVRAAERLGGRLWGVRLDTPGSRRGNMRRIVEEVRWTLRLMGRDDVRIVVSGGIDEEEAAELRDVVDVFGVGTAIAFPPSIDISMDIVEVEVDGVWVPITKRGKLPGFKQVYRCGDSRIMVPWGQGARCPDGSEPVPLLAKHMEGGKTLVDLPTEPEIRRYVLEQVSGLDL